MTRLFESFFLGGFECSAQRRKDGTRLDLIAATRHDVFAAQDYLALRRHGIHTVRDGVRWHLIERSAGQYDWSSFLPMLRAADDVGVQAVWDLCHYGWPDDIDIWSPQFVDRFARFAGALARLVRDEVDAQAWYCPVNEISFFAWAGGDMASLRPSAAGRGSELKRQLVRSSIAAIDAIKEVDPDAQIVNVDPVFHVLPDAPHEREKARRATEVQFEAWDMMAGHTLPGLGGGPGYLDVIGVNFYSYNQWSLSGVTVRRDDHNYRPFRDILADVYRRYQRPLFVAETGAEDHHRVPWLRYVCGEVNAARKAGIPVGGICLYPITDYPGWDDLRHCRVGLLGYADAKGVRRVHDDLATELSRQQRIFSQLAARTRRQNGLRISGQR